MTDTTYLGEIWVNGHRRAPGDAFPGGGGGGGGNPGGDVLLGDPIEPGLVDTTIWTRCDDPVTALEVNVDAAAAEATKEFERLASQRIPAETLNNREWGAPLFQMPDGRIVIGNIRSGEATFQNPGPTGRPNVDVDWSGPPDGLLVGMVHSHYAGGHVPSGSSTTSGDQDSLRYIRPVREQAGASPNQARLYIAALNLGGAGEPQYAKINVYNHTNQAAAIAGQEGPEVNPDGEPCPSQ